MDRPWEAFDRARRVLRGRDDLVGWKSADLPSVKEGWPCGEMPSKSELREHMLACAALRYKVGLVYHGNAAETGEYLYDPNYTPTRDIEQVVHTLSAMFKPTSVEPELRQGL